MNWKILWRFVSVGLMLTLAAARWSEAQASGAAVAGFDRYVAGVETRLTEQHLRRGGFLADVGAPPSADLLRAGDLVLQRMTSAREEDLPGALLQSWRGTAFVSGGKAAEFERLLRDFNRYPEVFAPEVLRGDVAGSDGDRLQASLRVRQKHVLTVVMDARYEVTFGRLDVADGYSASRSTGIREIEAAGTAAERSLSATEEHGFLWRLNSYWTWQERDGGLYVQIETVSLSRAIPMGLGWALRPYVTSVPRESLEFTLRAACNAVRRTGR